MQLISIFFEAVLLFILTLMVFTGLGYWLLTFINLGKKINELERFVLANVLSFSIFGTTLFLFGMVLNISVYISLYLFVPLGLYKFIKNYHLVKNSWTILIEQKKTALFALFSGVLMAATLAGSWIVTPNGLYIQNGQVHDSVWHIALIKNLKQSLPPLHPSSYTETLTHYHYFYDLVIASISESFAISDTVLYFQVFPFYLTLLLSLSVIIFARNFKDERMSFYLLLLTYYGGGFTYLLPFFLDGHSGQESSFWVSQTFSMMLNPQLIYSFSLMYCALHLMKKIYNESNNIWVLHVPIIILTITSIGFKSYSFIVLLVMYGVFLLTLLYKTKKLQYIALGIITLIVSLPLFILVVGNQSSGTFFYRPLWFIETMVVAEDRLNFVKAKLIEDFYRENGEIGKVFIIKLIEIIVFYIGNLGTRFFFLFLPLFYFVKRLKPKDGAFLFVLLIAFLTTSIFPLFFLQTGTVWNSIQFWYYSLIIANILVAYTLMQLSTLFSSNLKSKALYLSLTAIFIIATIIPYLQTIGNKIPVFEKISPDIVFILNQVEPENKVLVCPKSAVLYTNSLVTAYTNAGTYFVDVGQLALTGMKDVELKEANLQEMLYDNDQNALQKFIEDEGITTIICNKDNMKLENLKNVTVLFID